MPYDFMDVIIAEELFNEHEANSVLKITAPHLYFA